MMRECAIFGGKNRVALDSLTAFDALTRRSIEGVERAQRVSWASSTGVAGLVDELVMARRGPNRVPVRASHPRARSEWSGDTTR